MPKIWIRRVLVTLTVGACVAASMAASARSLVGDSRTPAQRVTTVEASLSTAVARLRTNAGVPPLVLDPALVRAASAHSLEMVEHGFFSHVSLDGTPMEARIARYYPRPTNGRRWSVGEVLFWGQGSASAAHAMATWLSSATHRARLLDPRFRNVGVSAVFSRSAPGAFGGRPVLVVTLVLGRR